MQRFEYLSDLASVIVEIPLDHPTRVAIDGVDGVGKTTLADELVPLIQGAGRQVIRASVDGFQCSIARLKGPYNNRLELTAAAVILIS